MDGSAVDFDLLLRPGAQVVLARAREAPRAAFSRRTDLPAPCGRAAQLTQPAGLEASP